MIIKQYIKDFEKLGFGMFVHFGLYSTIERGEWVQAYGPVPVEEYEKSIADFKVKESWAQELVSTAKRAGCRYIVLTTRHHDGFSLYDTCGLSDYDAPHSPTGRDLVREFADECRRQDIIPFFYHTLIDWHKPEANTDFKAYLKYLRASVELLCKNYGKIGGIWFDGIWSDATDDWEEDELYAVIRKYQPEAMIISNSGTANLGGKGHIELDSVTFERGNPFRIDMTGQPKYLAGEMNQIMGEHWGYAKKCLRYKPFSEILGNLVDCRRVHANFLLNVGPVGDGTIPPRDMGYFEMLGVWFEANGEAVYDTEPTDYRVLTSDKDFILHNTERDCYYLYMLGKPDDEVEFEFDRPVKAVRCLDENKNTAFEQCGGRVKFKADNYIFGTDYLVRVAKIECEE